MTNEDLQRDFQDRQETYGVTRNEGKNYHPRTIIDSRGRVRYRGPRWRAGQKASMQGEMTAKLNCGACLLLFAEPA